MVLLRRCSRKGISMNFEAKHHGEPMFQESNWNPLDWCAESLHSSEVVNPRQLKYCEGCGILQVRLQGSGAQFCFRCKPPLPIAIRRMQ